MATNHDEVTGASVFIHTQDMQITKSNLIDALSQTWIVGSGASFHVTPIKECFTTLMSAAMDIYSLEKTMVALLKVLAQFIS